MENAQAREIGSYFLERTHHYAPRMTLHYIYIYIYICVYVYMYCTICIYITWKCKTCNLTERTRIDRESSISKPRAFAANRSNREKRLSWILLAR